MKRLIVLLLSSISIQTEAYPQPRIQVYEIRKSNENRDVDTHYYDLDGSTKDDFMENIAKIHKKINLKSLNKLIKLLSANEDVKPVNKLKTFSNRIYSKDRNEFKKIDSDLDRLSRADIVSFDDKESRSEDLSKLIQYLTRTDEDRMSDNSEFEDLTRSSPLVIVSVDEQPQDVTALGKLLRSPLRTQYYEDRTAPPPNARPYDIDF
ncbi:uncharacterized protein LOC111001545 [Pieris rapae]|uniref:uncharacterized protein LOC111001545 n=1 Tax=Pieris rapae TaxID=64459 RepID=UPI000B92B20B|nr:uncharacterized protein LOC111001545 [Pieris rapae]